MCANYIPVKDSERLKRYFGVGNHPAFPEETWPGYVAPFVLQSQDQATHERELAIGIFGLVPHWAKDLTVARHTYNARAETASEKPSYRDAWRHGHRCIGAGRVIFRAQLGVRQGRTLADSAQRWRSNGIGRLMGGVDNARWARNFIVHDADY